MLVRHKSVLREVGNSLVMYIRTTRENNMGLVDSTPPRNEPL